MKSFKQFIKEAAPRAPSKENKKIDNTVSDFARGAYNSATMDLGKYGRAAVDYGIKNLGAAVGYGKGTTYSKELDQEKEKDTVAQTRSPDAYKYGGYTADAASMATGVGGIIKTVAKVGERQTAKTLGKWLAKDQEAGRLNIPRDNIHADIKARYPDTPQGNALLDKDLTNPKTKHTMWSLGQHMENDPAVQKRIVDSLKRNNPTDKRIQFTTDRMNVNQYGKETFGKETWDKVRDPTLKYDPGKKDFRPRVDNDPKPGFEPKINDKGETINTIDTAAKSRARLRTGGADENPYLRQAVAATKSKTQPSYSNRWDDVPKRSIADKVVDKIIGAKYDQYGNYVGK